MDMNPSMKDFSWSEVAMRGLQERIPSSKFRRKNGPRQQSAVTVVVFEVEGFRS